MTRTVSILLFLCCVSLALAGNVINLTSPDGKMVIRFRLDEQGRPGWQVNRTGKEILSWSDLGLRFQGAPDLSKGLRLLDTTRNDHDETYELVAAKVHNARDHHRALHVALQESAPPRRSLELEFRAFDDGVAFRYLLPKDGGISTFAITRELTEFHFPADLKAWAFQINTFHSSFEGNYLPLMVGAIPDTALVHPPLTMQRSDGVTLAITEADLTDYAGMYLRGLPGAALQVVLAPRLNESPVCVRGTTPFVSPWRVLMIGGKPGELIESTIIENLNPPSVLKDVSWIKPGKAIFPWWPNFFSDKPGVPSKMGFENQKYYIDFAADNRLEYLELEPPWYGDEDGCINRPENYDIIRPLPELRLPDLFAHARSRHVGIFLWNHWQNVDRQGDSAFALYQLWGAAGVKIDFMNRDDQEMVQWYQKALRMTAAHQLMVYFHGAYKPTGLRRTYPHLVTQEGVLGNEQNKVTYLATMEHTMTLPFTRMLAGPMDFTPGGFRNATREEFKPVYDRPMVLGTRCHQLAMFVVYESPLQMVCDDPSAYRDQPGLSFIRDVPTAWDETHVLRGEIGEYIIIARKHGTEWYLGAMTNWTTRDFTVPLTFLGDGDYQAEEYADGPDADTHPVSITISHKIISRQQVLRMRLASGGGMVIRFYPR
jgi:alpha-glucosidase